MRGVKHGMYLHLIIKSGRAYCRMHTIGCRVETGYTSQQGVLNEAFAPGLRPDIIAGKAGNRVHLNLPAAYQNCADLFHMHETWI